MLKLVQLNWNWKGWCDNRPAQAETQQYKWCNCVVHQGINKHWDGMQGNEYGRVRPPLGIWHVGMAGIFTSAYYFPWPHFYQTRSAWSMDQGSHENHSPVNNFAPTVTKFCVMWEGQALPHDTKFGIKDLIHGSSWSGLIKLGPG